MNIFEWVIKKAIPWHTGLGITSRTVTLEVMGRKSGKLKRVSLPKTKSNGKEFFAPGWKRGAKVRREAVALPVALPREAVSLSVALSVNTAYVQSRPFAHSRPEASKLFFGPGLKPAMDEMKAIAYKYVVFLITGTNG